MVLDPNLRPGGAWLEIVNRPTIMGFARAFSLNPILEATVLASPLQGLGSLYRFFCTTRSMYERITFLQEIRSESRLCLEWEGIFQGNPISGATILVYDAERGIERIRIFHFPNEQLTAFSAQLARRYASNPELINKPTWSAA